MASSDAQSGVLQALEYACNQDPSVLKVGEQQLKFWENQEGFYSALACVIRELSVDVSVRWMAITYIKNGVDKYWRPGAPNAIAEEEKTVIRSTLLQCLEEPVQQVSTQLAVLMARIARLDCPDNWPELLPLLTEGVQSTNPLLQKCSLTTMKHVIKTLAARRLAPQRKSFYAVTLGLFVYLAKLWTTYLQESLPQLSSGEGVEPGLVTLEMSRTCLKILRQMIVHGFPKFHAVLEALQFLHQVLERVPVFLQLRSQLLPDHTTSAPLEQNINLMMKTLHDVQSHHPIGFVSFLTPSLQLVYTTLFEPNNEGQLYEQFVIQALSLLRQIVKCEDYTLPTDLRLTESSPPPQVIEAQRAKLGFFKASTCQAILQRLVCHYMPLSVQELRQWEEDPEEFAQERAGETHQYSHRACVETMYVCFLHEYQQTLTPTMLTLISDVQAIDANADYDSLRLKEAVYKAAGLGAFQLYDDVDFDSWYQGQLLAELQVHEPRYKIVRHRVVWLIGNWATVKLSPPLLPSIYSTLLTVLQPHENLVIRLTAADSLKMVIDDFDFTAEEFSPHLADCVQLLVQLLCDTSQPDTKLRVLLVLSVLMERMGPHIQPHVPSLLHCLPSLWENSTQENSSLLRVGILSTLTNIVRGLGKLSMQLHDFILPVVHLATDVTVSEHVYLMEEGLDLWAAIIHHSPTSSAPLLHLITNFAGLLGLNSTDGSTNSTTNFSADNLNMCFSILDSYCLLCASQPDEFMQSCADVVMQSCQSYLREVKSEGVIIIVRVLEHLVQLYPSHVPSLMPSILPNILTDLLDEETHPPTVSSHLSLLARILLQHSTFFFSFLEQMAARSQQTPATLFGHLIDFWSEKLDEMSQIHRRKLSGLAMASLLPLDDVSVTSRFGGIVNMCVGVLHDVMDTTDDDILYDQLVTTSGREQDGATVETEHDKRERQLDSYDPVYTIAFHEFVTSKLEACAVVHGTAAYHTLMQSVDGVVKEQLAAFLPQERLPSILAVDAL